MATIDTKESVLPPTSAPVPQSSATPPSPPHSSGRETLPKHSIEAHDSSTPPFSPASDTPVLQKEQEEFEGTVDVNNDLPSEKDLKQVEDLLILDAQGKSRPFRELYDASGVAPRQLIIFIRHFFCGNCQEYLRTLSSSMTPEDLLALPTPTSITVIGCGRPELIPMYTEATGCSFPIYAEPTRKIYDHLGMTRTYDLGAKPAYMHTSLLINSVQSIFQGLSTGRKALKGGDFKQVGGEFLFENGECTWVHRMKTTRGHVEVSDIRGLLGLDDRRPPMRKRWSHSVKQEKQSNRRSVSWGRLRSKSKGVKDLGKSGSTTPERVDEEDPNRLLGRTTA
ncbi:uncharacterized protein M421DRAFT_93091 [Didymella exigua CBS 183.55]|uniref:AhpC-TSA-domain-containing protein n=1 Tax=Didymella exigua CBS 183.55 TaxID=1150837 RepID=A0A6A5RJ98_9PLEO|nr:uncharacterized protein M421DRAFT_93091 [Didymella exigua CBS 183.55]KAF1927709.1 hypothetical protein M421DRAFT_93091 [Didymella exigua CBS 183.55]